jgi:hypothetical protein
VTRWQAGVRRSASPRWFPGDRVCTFAFSSYFLLLLPLQGLHLMYDIPWNKTTLDTPQPTANMQQGHRTTATGPS